MTGTGPVKAWHCLQQYELKTRVLAGWWLSPTLWKIWKSLGTTIPNIWNINFMFQNPNQMVIHPTDPQPNGGRLVLKQQNPSISWRNLLELEQDICLGWYSILNIIQIHLQWTRSVVVVRKRTYTCGGIVLIMGIHSRAHLKQLQDIYYRPKKPPYSPLDAHINPWLICLTFWLFNIAMEHGPFVDDFRWFSGFPFGKLTSLWKITILIGKSTVIFGHFQ